MKRCGKCKTNKPLEDFYNRKTSKDGKGSRCKSCDNEARRESRARAPKGTQDGYRRRSLQRKYGITLGDYDEMLKSQGNKCAICETDNPYGEGNSGSQSYFSFSVDHCHSTGNNRGLLCNTCNRGLGFFKDNIDLLVRSIDYLKKHR